jgi:hypothetical protein
MHAVACAHLSVKRVDQRGGKTALPKRLTNSAKTKKYYGIKKLPYSFLMRLNTLVLSLEPQLLQNQSIPIPKCFSTYPVIHTLNATMIPVYKI